MAGEKTLSIVIPVFNVEKYLGRCLDSLLKTPGIEKTEILIIDDGSTDTSGRIADSYAENHEFICCFHKANGGLSDARNYGLDKASGKYVFFLDSDDMVAPSAMETIIKKVSDSDADILLWDGQVIDEDDAVFDSKYNLILSHAGLPTNGESITGVEAMVRQIKDHDKIAMTAWSRACRRDFLIGNGLLFEPGLTHEDELWTPKVFLKAESVTYIPEKVYCYRIRANSIISSSAGNQEKHEKDLIRIMKELPVCYEHSVKDEKSRRLLLGNWADTYLWELVEYGFDKYECRKEIPKLEIIRLGHGIKKLALIFGVKYYCSTVRFWRKRKEDITKFRRLIKYASEIRKYQAVMLNSPLHGNLGDQAIFLAEDEYCRSLGISLLDYPWPTRAISLYAKLTPKKCMVLIHGGGNLGQIWPDQEMKTRNILRHFRKHKVIILPQTAYWDFNTEEGRSCLEASKECYSAHPDLTVFLREKFSYETIKKYMPELRAFLVPDMAMMLHARFDLERHGTLICMRNDVEKTLSDEDESRIILSLDDKNLKYLRTDLCFDRMIKPDERKTAVYRKLGQFASSELVITDRLHGMIFAYITGTPCIVIESLSHKIRGCYEWIKDSPAVRIASPEDDISILIDDVLNAVPDYDNDKIISAMKTLGNVLRE